MARRSVAKAEGSGRVVGLMLFFLLFVVFAVLWYMQFEQNDKLVQLNTQLQKDKKDIEQERDAAKQAYGEIVGLLVDTLKDGAHEQYMKMGNEILKSPVLPADGDYRTALAPSGSYSNFSKAVAWLQEALAKEVDARKKAERERDETVVSKDALIEAEKKQVVEVREDLKTKEAKFAADLAKFNADLDNYKSIVTKAAEDAANLRIQVRQKEEDMKLQENKHKSALAKALAVADARDALERRKKEMQFEDSDGEITALTEAGSGAYLNVGSDDGLRVGMTFGIYGRDVSGNPMVVPKAQLEVSSIEGPHRARARITGQDTKDPVLTGDHIYNPIWSPGVKETVAFVGFIHMNKYKTEDNEEFHRLVEANGGKVVSHVVIENGKAVRKGVTPLPVGTGWLVLGEIPEQGSGIYDQEKTLLANAIRERRNDMIVEAINSGIRVIHYRNFLTYMGKNVPPNTVPSGSEHKFLFGKELPKTGDPLSSEKYTPKKKS